MNEQNEQQQIASALADKRGEEILIMDLSDTSSIADTFVIVTANSDVHMETLRNAIEDTMDNYDHDYLVEGQNSTQWCLIDGGNIVVHIFSKKSRTFYNLEKIWGDTPTQRYEYEM